MKLSCLPVSFFPDIIDGRMSITQWALMAKELGLDAIDLSILFFRDRNANFLKDSRKAIDQAGIHIAVINTYPDFTAPDLTKRNQQLSQLKTDIFLATALGAKMLRITAGQAYPGIKRDQAIKQVTEAFNLALEVSRQCGIKLVFENHSKPGIWTYPDFCLQTDIFMEIAAAIVDTQIGILFDTANPLVYGDDPLPVLHQVIDRLCCVHIADTKIRGQLQPVLVGTGIVPFNDIFNVLKTSGYDGYLSIEEASFLGKTGIEDAVKFVRKSWND